MSNETEQDLLKQFFSAYFNEDWHCDAETPEEIVADYMSAASPEEVDVCR